MAQSRRLSDLAGAINQRARLPEPPHVIALSGGADSAALADMVIGNFDDPPRCVHVHHGLAHSDLLAAAAESIADELSLSVDVVAVQIPEGPSPEAMAREVRYSALETSLRTNESMLLGHTRNDQAETVLLNLVRGSGMRGLAGMPYRRGTRFFRPFLDVSRDETREYAKLRGLPFVDDPTNSDRTIRRNRIRLDVIPRLEELNPNLVEALARTAEYVREDSEYLDRLAVLPANSGDNSARVPTGVLAALDRPVRSRTIAGLVASVREREGLTSAELARIEDVLDGRSGRAELEGGVAVDKAGPFLVVTSTVDS
ncbi:MAG TPA: tRNA lysidine(34) synthetase TilS [Acidimicrobiia bacterium]|nr:tRNA lysidine(34) synthetase TilS [Acidimicrobiia bacterium]